MRAAALLLPVALLFATTGEADARSRHERVKLVPINKSGKVVGFKLTLTLRPEDYNHDRVRIGLSPGGKSSDVDYRNKASNMSKGHLLFQWPEIDKLKTNKPEVRTLTLLYKDAPKLKPGQTVELVSAWSDSAKSYWHIWGLTTGISGRVAKYTMPGKPTAAAKAKATAATPKAKATAATSKAKAKSKTTATRLPKAKATATRAKPTAARTPKPTSRARTASTTRARRGTPR